MGQQPKRRFDITIGRDWDAADWAWFVLMCGLAVALVVGAFRGH